MFVSLICVNKNFGRDFSLKTCITDLLLLVDETIKMFLFFPRTQLPTRWLLIHKIVNSQKQKTI